MECLEINQLLEFAMMVGNWICMHFEEGQFIFGTETATFEWRLREDGVFCYVGEQA